MFLCSTENKLIYFGIYLTTNNEFIQLKSYSYEGRKQTIRRWYFPKRNIG